MENNKNIGICEYCHKEFDKSSTSSTRFCSKHCAAMFSNSKIDFTKKKHTVCANCGKDIVIALTAGKSYCKECRKIVKDRQRNKRCALCGAELKRCKHPEICSLFSYRSIQGLINHLEFDEKCFGTEKFYDEYFRVKEELSRLYFDEKMSTGLLAEHYRHNDTCNFIKIIKKFIKLRNHKEATEVGWISGRNVVLPTPIYPYKSEWHTTWNGKRVFLRSSYELDFALKLDEEKIDYEVESLRIQYFDSVKNEERIAIPDFYLPVTNEIIEIKSNYTLDVQNIKDKFAEYVTLGYSPRLILNKIETSIDSL